VVQFKQEVRQADALEELNILQSSGKLTEEKWHELTRKTFGDAGTITDGPVVTPWPQPLGEAALYGLAGDFVRLVEPHTEADPAALLLQFLVASGNIVGHEPHFVAEETWHHLNLYTVIVGATSQSRKGTSWNRVKARFCPLDSEWKVKSGLVSGEGVIEQFRDTTPKGTDVEEQNGDGEWAEAIDAAPIAFDERYKRLMLCESEFSNLLRVASREANTLSTVLMQAWDGSNLYNLTKKNPAETHGAHLSLVGHITHEELKLRLSKVDTVNGFANRFLWTCARRSKELPHGGCMDAIEVAKLDARLKKAIEFGRDVKEMNRSRQANKLWEEGYSELTKAHAGTFGAVTSRGVAQVNRLSCVYALLDKSPVVQTQHLRAALAVWRYCEDSAKFIFGNSLGDPNADKILTALRQSKDGLTRTQISLQVLRGNEDATEISRVMGVLVKYGLVNMTPSREPGQKKPTEIWKANP
jgi:hypothetical protein